MVKPAPDLRYSRAMSKDSKNPEVRDLKALMNRGPRNRWEGMKLRALKNRYPGVADTALTTHQQIPTTPPQPEE